ncbi:glutamate--tRNA ligase [Pectinatus frisingensis]|uniref:glutamate--tRNA ligase n=1 Tax=Pectinatus frisingensis TaxID=865 RepID=UPI003D801DF3
MSEQIRVRFAPSPTGPFHIGGARSALFNWLLARKYPEGKFVLRIEDTDRVRSSKESEENIKESLKWLGLTWDEGVDAGGDYGPYHQMERLDIYRQYAQKLLDEGKAYYCYCTEAEIAKERETLMKANKMPIYQGHCRNLTDEQIEKYKAEGRKPTIRFRTPENKTVEFDDMVRGHMQFDSNGVGDFVIMKADGIPVYNFAVVVDDALMKISHVVRAEEHLSNTPRQVVLYHALGFKVPMFAHISLILGKDHSKMSKRHGATSVEQYKKLGYLPEAIVNFLALLGWASQSEQEIFSIDELVKEFSMEHVAKNPAVFDIDKLNWLNAQYMKKLSSEKITMMAIPHLVEKGYLTGALATEEMARLVRFTEIIRDHLSYGAQYLDFADLYFNDEITIDNSDAKVVVTDETALPVLDLFKQKLSAVDIFDAAHIQPIFKQITKELKVSGKKVYMPVRVALTGQMHGPDLAGIIEVVGYDRIMKRLEKAMSVIKTL